MMFEISQEDISGVFEKYVTCNNPFKISLFPPKEKRKYILLCRIVHQFEHDRIYTEKEVNELLQSIYHDYATIRRYLVVYRFLDRKTDGSAYWLIADKNDYLEYLLH